AAFVSGVSWSVDAHYVISGLESTAGPELRVYTADTTGAQRCVVQNCTVNCVNGQNGSGVGISASSQENFIYSNVAFSDDINYALVTNVYTGGILGVPTVLENISIPPL